jgi:diamine N-acetyltransferase
MTEFIQATNDSQIKEIADMAEIIWNEHFVPIIGQEQVDYMVEKFQSFPALKSQIEDGYEYYQIVYESKMAGYTGIHEEDGRLFLSKLYIHPDFRGKHLATEGFEFLVALAKERKLSDIWLTCNRYNKNTLSIYDHFGFVVIDEQKNDIGNGFFMDDYIMSYKL